MSDKIILSQLALAPVAGKAVFSDVQDMASRIHDVGQERFVDFLVRHELAPLWHDFLQAEESLAAVFTDTRLRLLKNEKIKNTALLLIQDRILEETHHLFEARNIPYLVFKGASLRHTHFADPAQRTCSDIDILVPEAKKLDAARCLVESGYRIDIDKNNISHEVSLESHAVTIDLHWNLMRPGRARTDLNQLLLENRHWTGRFYGLKDNQHLQVMLIHPAITKYINSPVALLVHMVDLHYLIHSPGIDLDECMQTLDDAGLKTAAWASLYWYQRLAGNEWIVEVIQKHQPGPLRRKYLQYWIDHELVSRLWQHQYLVKPLFGLQLQDNLEDMLHALRCLREEKRQADDKAREFESLLPSSMMG